MSKKCFVPVESWALASPELLLSGKKTDVGLFAESLIFFDNIVLNIQSSHHLADILKSFKDCFDDIQPFLELIISGVVQIHYFDFISAPIEKDGIYSYWNIQDQTSESSNMLSFQQKILYQKAIEEILPKARNRQKLYSTVAETALVDSSSAYGIAIEASRTAINSHDDLERLLGDFVPSLPLQYRSLFPSKIVVTAEQLSVG